MIDLKELADFLVRAKTMTYAAGGKEIVPQRPGFKELEFKEGGWEYRDSYTGFFSAPGQEVVRHNGKPVWAMAYSGGMLPKHHDLSFAKQTFTFLKECLSRVKANKPFRGPEHFKSGDFEYKTSNKGDITDFMGTEQIYYKGKVVFRQYYIGGLIAGK